jgi:hypothetical protein
LFASNIANIEKDNIESIGSFNMSKADHLMKFLRKLELNIDKKYFVLQGKEITVKPELATTNLQRPFWCLNLLA